MGRDYRSRMMVRGSAKLADEQHKSLRAALADGLDDYCSQRQCLSGQPDRVFRLSFECGAQQDLAGDGVYIYYQLTGIGRRNIDVAADGRIGVDAYEGIGIGASDGDRADG